MTVSLTLILLGLLCVWRGLRRKGSRVTPSQFKPTPWDEFRRRVCQATGAETVHEAIKRDEVTVLPGGWLEFGDLAYHADESATVADLWQARADFAAQQPSSPGEHDVMGGWDTCVWSSPGFEPVTYWALVDEPHSPPTERTSPWVGRQVFCKDADGDTYSQECVWASEDTLTLADGSTVPAAEAELHWDDVRVGDIQARDAYIDRVTRTVEDIDGDGMLGLRGVGCRIYTKPHHGDIFTPAAA